MDPDKNIAVKCDLCGGDPQCVKACRLPQALKYVEGDLLTVLKERDRVDKNAKALLISSTIGEVD